MDLILAAFVSFHLHAANTAISHRHGRLYDVLSSLGGTALMFLQISHQP